MRSKKQKEIELGNVWGIRFTASQSAVIGSLVLWLGLALLGVVGLHLLTWIALLGGLLGVALHWLSDTGHQLGHAWAARQVGWPMSGLRYFGLLSTSLYPKNEPLLPGRVHIRRALGGPAASLLLALLGVAWVWAAGGSGSLMDWLGRFFLFDNLVVFGLGAFIPLGFTDGSTLLEWIGKDGKAGTGKKLATRDRRRPSKARPRM
jgi:hypothetical protein